MEGGIYLQHTVGPDTQDKTRKIPVRPRWGKYPTTISGKNNTQILICAQIYGNISYPKLFFKGPKNYTPEFAISRIRPDQNQILISCSSRETCRLSLAVTKPNTLAFNWKQGLDRITIRLRVEVSTHTTPTPFSPTPFSPTPFSLLECTVKYRNLSFAGPYVVRQSNEQKFMLHPKYSLKKVVVKLQAISQP